MSEVAPSIPGELGRVFDVYGEMVFGFLLGRCGDRALAEDLAGETFVAASQLFMQGRGGEVTPSWLRTVARRRLIDHWRRLTTRRHGLEYLRMASQPRVATDTDPDGLIDLALASLPARQQAALLLRYVDEFSTSEVAETLSVSYKAAESLLTRARTAFRTAYEGQTNEGQTNG